MCEVVIGEEEKSFRVILLSYPAPLVAHSGSCRVAFFDVIAMMYCISRQVRFALVERESKLVFSSLSEDLQNDFN